MGDRSTALQLPTLAFAAFFFWFIGAGDAAAINRCEGPGGRVTFQDGPCEGKGRQITVRPSRGKVKEPEPLGAASAPSAKPADDSGDPGMSRAERINASVEESQRQRRLDNLKGRLIPREEKLMRGLEQTCDREHAKLQKLREKDPTNEIHIADQLTLAHRCNTKQRGHLKRIEKLKEECKSLFGDC
ncbi:DUF4124 domain-containing protein [Hydrogenophaga sp. 5NK40-0174]|uniref:DUF4124 domain-containing protein n=1 Tax=Hydrogenophaga sp. 5NK40-0174 TaxID=3127649 RepID=UPI0031088041